MSPESMPELVGLALACGAHDVGGPLSRAEIALAECAAPVSRADARRVRAAIREGDDPLGSMFCNLRRQIERRRLGAFYTDSAIVEPMVSWAFSQKPTRFVDPGSGSGRFSVAAAKHNRNIAIVAIDLDPVATLLTRAALGAIGAKRSRVLQQDFLTAEIGKVDGRTAFVGNPPYVRHHELDLATKAWASSLAMKVGHTISGLAGLHTLFYLATLGRHGSPGDVGSFVTSAEWLDTGYGSLIRAIFTNGLGGRSLTVYDPELAAFTGAMTTAAITTFLIGDEPAATRIRRVTKRTTTLKLEQGGRNVARVELAQAHRWSPLVKSLDHRVAGPTLGTLFRVSRGQVTGANKYFTMTRDEACRRGIDQFCIPLVTTAQEVFNASGAIHQQSVQRVGLQIPRDISVRDFPDLEKYLDLGEALGLHKRYVAAHRSPWWSITFPKPPIIATYMARQPPMFAVNPDRVGIINVLHGLYPKGDIENEALGQIVDELNATRNGFVGRGRTYHGGLEKFEPSEMEALPLMGIAFGE